MSIEATTVTPSPNDPAAVESDEAKAHQHRMAQAQGDTYNTALTHMSEKVANVGAEAHAGDMIVAFAIEGAEGMYEPRNGELQWVKPTEENFHIEISARDATDNRFLPGLAVRVRVLDDQGHEVVAQDLPMLWHPWLYHYGANVTLPEGVALTLEVEIESPKFPRHDQKNGDRYKDDVFVRFEGIELSAD